MRIRVEERFPACAARYPTVARQIQISMRISGTLSKIMSASSSAAPRILEGVFAIHKPKSISSAQVIRDLQDAFIPSKLFAPLVEDEKRRRNRESRGQRNRRRDKSIRLKIGHGGTLDPMATGVLIIGIGRGTKHLTNFLHCTKSYTTTMMFGAATDTYDIMGKILSRAPYEHVTNEKVEAALTGFRGQVMQTPPIYSALKQDGKKLYEYAREGKEPPRAIEQRSVTVEKLEVVEWLDKHEYSLPAEDAPQAEKEVAAKVLKLDEVGDADRKPPTDASVGQKRQREDGDAPKDEPPAKRQQADAEETGETAVLETDHTKAEKPQEETPTENGDEVNDSLKQSAEKENSDHKPPAVTLEMTVTSGFYVRSLCHDLGKAVDSHGLMAELVRSRQGEYILHENVFEYDDLAKGEETWGPVVERMLEDWLAKNPG